MLNKEFKFLTEEQKQKIEKYYNLEIDSTKGYRLPQVYISRKGTEKKSEVLFDAYLTFDVKNIDRTKIKEYLSNGDILAINRKNVLISYGVLTEEKYNDIETNTDKRTRIYLEKILTNNNFISLTDGSGVDKKYESVINKELDIYKIDENYGVLEGSFIPPDDYQEDLFIFSEIPTQRQLDIVKKVIDIYTNFGLLRYEFVFDCCGCGNKTHWLDYNGSFEEKIEALENRHCGC